MHEKRYDLKIEAAWAFRRGGFLYPAAPRYLHSHAAQLQRPGSQEQDLPHWQPAAFTLVLRFFVWCLRYVFIVIDFFVCYDAFPALLPGSIGRSPELTDHHEIHYTLFSGSMNLNDNAPVRSNPRTCSQDIHACCTPDNSAQGHPADACARGVVARSDYFVSRRASPRLLQNLSPLNRPLPTTPDIAAAPKAEGGGSTDTKPVRPSYPGFQELLFRTAPTRGFAPLVSGTRQ